MLRVLIPCFLATAWALSADAGKVKSQAPKKGPGGGNLIANGKKGMMNHCPETSPQFLSLGNQNVNTSSQPAVINPQILNPNMSFRVPMMPASRPPQLSIPKTPFLVPLVPTNYQTQIFTPKSPFLVPMMPTSGYPLFFPPGGTAASLQIPVKPGNPNWKNGLNPPASNQKVTATPEAFFSGLTSSQPSKQLPTNLGITVFSSDNDTFAVQFNSMTPAQREAVIQGIKTNTAMADNFLRAIQRIPTQAGRNGADFPGSRLDPAKINLALPAW